jgi:predicted Zn finger-like uncharacterized protein
MIIECPVCPKPAPRYKIDAALIGDEGRDVRCPRCGHEWFVTPEDFARFARARGQNAQAQDTQAQSSYGQSSYAHSNPGAESDPSGALYNADVHGDLYGGVRPDAQQIVGATFSCAPPYDDADDGAPLDDHGFAPDPLPQTPPEGVSAGAALAIAAAGSQNEASGAGLPAEAAGSPHVPSTAAEIASAFFASSFEEPVEEALDETPDKPQTSFSLWSALDSVRPDDGYASETPPEKELVEGAREAKTAFHAASQTHDAFAHDDFAHDAYVHDDLPHDNLADDGVDFGETEDFDSPPAYEAPDDEDALPSGDTFWGRTLQGGDDKPDDAGEPAYEPAYKHAAPASSGAEERDEELAAALASAASWGHEDLSLNENLPLNDDLPLSNDLPLEASSPKGVAPPQRREEGLDPLPRPSRGEESWEPAPAPEASEITRLVQALNGHEAAKTAAQEFAAQEYAAEEYAAQEYVAQDDVDQQYPSTEFTRDSAPETSKEPAWPAGRKVHVEDFRRRDGWPAADETGDASAPPNPNVAGERETPPYQPPSFLRTRRAQEHEDLYEQPDRERMRPASAHPAEVDYEGEEDYLAEYDEAMAAVQPRRMGGLTVAASWGVFLTIIAGLGGAAIHFREGVIDRMPETAKLYQALHMSVASREVKLDFANIKYRWAMRDEQPMIAIEGDIISLSNTIEPVPLIAVAVRDPEHSSPTPRLEEVQIKQVEPNGSAHFTLDVAAPPKGVNEIALEFKK